MKVNSPFHSHSETEITDWIEDNSPVTRFASISAMSAVFTGTFLTDLPNRRMSNATGITETLFKDIQLPHGAIVTQFTHIVELTNTGDSVTGRLMRKNLTTGGQDILALVSHTGSLGVIRVEDDTISNATIDNDLYSYFVEWLSSASVGVIQYFYGAIVNYTVVNPQP